MGRSQVLGLLCNRTIFGNGQRGRGTNGDGSEISTVDMAGGWKIDAGRRVH